MKSALSKLRKIKPPQLMFFGGIALVAVGVGMHDLGAGLAAAGAVALLSLKPLSGWLFEAKDRTHNGK
jgi:hypothetical protein